MNEHLNSFYQKAREHNDIANDLFRKYDIKKGLRNEDGTGVRVGLTKIADVVGYKYVEEVKTDDIGKLYYRGIELRDIIHGRNYETSFCAGRQPPAGRWRCWGQNDRPAA